MGLECLVCSSEIETLGCGLTEPELVRIRQFSTSLEIKKKQVFIREDDPQDFYYQIFYGVAGVYNYLPNGRRIITELLFAGDFIGPQVNNIYPFSVESLQTVYLCRFQKKKLDELIKETPTLKDKLNFFQQKAINKARGHLLSVSHKAPVVRLGSFLLFICNNVESTKQGFRVPMGRADIADYLGLTSETVSRAMTTLSDQGIIAMETPSFVTICNTLQLSYLVYGDKESPLSTNYSHLTAK